MSDFAWLEHQLIIQGLTVVCPKCFNKENSVKSCNQCIGWGYVKPGKDAECIHHWKEISKSTAQKLGIYHPGMCYHVYVCPKCETSMSQDSSG